MGFLDILRVLKYVWPFIKEIVFVSAQERVRSIKSLLATLFFISILGLAFTYWDFSPYQWLQSQRGQVTNTPIQDARSPKNQSNNQHSPVTNIERRYFELIQQNDRLIKKVKRLEMDIQELLEKKRRLEDQLSFLQRENRRLRETIDQIQQDVSDNKLDPNTQNRLEEYYD